MQVDPSENRNMCLIFLHVYWWWDSELDYYKRNGGVDVGSSARTKNLNTWLVVYELSFGFLRYNMM